MPNRVNQPMVEAFLVVDQPRQRLSHWTQALALLDDFHAPRPVAVAAYYDASTDQALLGVLYDQAVLGRDGLMFAVEIALLAEIGMIQPAELSAGERHRFLTERLARCSIHVGDRRGVVAALTELVRRVRDQEAIAKGRAVPGGEPVRAATPPPAQQPRARTIRGATVSPGPAVSARGTRDDLRPPAEAAASAPARSVEEAVDVDISDLTEVAPVDASVEATVVLASPQGRRPDTRPPPSPPTPDRHAPYASSESGPLPPGIIYARYLRSGRWVPIRIGALSLQGAALISGALPRLGEYVDIALSFGAHRALVRGSVGKVSSPEDVTQTGTATFSIGFELDDAARRQLTDLLTAARAANVTITPAPPRAARRYPIEWPLCLGTLRGAIRADALDISRQGMFVRPVHALQLHSVLNFSSVLDDGEPPIAGRAEVMRHIGDGEARASGLAAGFGLRVLEMSDEDRARWVAFVARIERRAERRVLVGASSARLAELQTGLAALGYAVSGGTDPRVLVQLARTEVRPVDAALIDAGWTPQASAQWIEAQLAARNVPCVTVRGDAKRARLAIDKLVFG